MVGGGGVQQSLLLLVYGRKWAPANDGLRVIFDFESTRLLRAHDAHL